MPFQINRRSLGVDDLVGGKSWPTVPSQFADQVVGVFDMTEGFLQSRQAGGFQANNLTTINTIVSFTVPSDEAWYVTGISTSGTVIAGATVVFQNWVGVPGLSGAIPVRLWGPPTPTVAAGAVFATSWQPNIWLPPGSTINTCLCGGSGFGVGQGFDTYWIGSRVRV